MRRIGFIVAFMLAGCGAETPPPSATVDKLVATPDPPVVTPQKPKNPETGPSTAPPPVIITASSLIGSTPRDIVGKFGEPSLVRRDAGLQAMLFERPECVLDLIFYEDDADGHFRLYQVMARNRAGSAADEQHCIDRLLALDR